MRSIEWYEETEWLNAALGAGGAFVVALDADRKPNPMTIGWAQVGIVWSIPTVSVLIRESRYTHSCIRRADSFAVCVPRPGELTAALAFCGSMSGRDVDKVEKAGLRLAPAKKIETPILEACGLHYECEIIARTQQTRADFGRGAADVLEKYYAEGDHHLVVHGRLVAAYVTRARAERSTR